MRFMSIVCSTLLLATMVALHAQADTAYEFAASLWDSVRQIRRHRDSRLMQTEPSP